MLVQRTEQHIIDRQSKWYKMLSEKCHQAKNIYNHGNYLIRQEFINTGKWLRYTEVEQLVKTDDVYTDYWDWNLANSGQQVLRQLDKNWRSFFNSIKDWTKHKDKYLGKPKLPKYLKKDGLCEFALTTNQIKLKSDNLVHFPKSMQGFVIKPQFIYDDRFVKFNQCRVVPKNDRIIIELIYTTAVENKPLDTINVGSIDLGIDNFVTFVDNLGSRPVIINGKGLKSCNKYYNELVSKAKSELDLNKNHQKYSHKLHSITNKRNDRIKHYMHRTSRYIVDLCQSSDITTLVVGKKDNWKQKSNMGKINNQTFVQIPYRILIQDLTYKCQEAGINLILSDEAYTSGTSFLDNEQPTKENYNMKRRIKRGLFKSNIGKLINADVNAAYQIMKKVFCDVEIPADRGFVLNPVRVNIYC